MKENIKTAAPFLFVILISFAVSYYLYPDYHPLGGLRVPADKQVIEQRALDIAADLGLKTEGYFINVTLRQDKVLIRALQRRNGLEKTNEILRQKIPGYYYSVSWKPEDIILFVQGEKQPGEPKIIWKSVKSLELKFDLNGNLLQLKRDIPDSVQSTPVYPVEAKRLANQFLSKYTLYTLTDDSQDKAPTVINKIKVPESGAGQDSDDEQPESRTDYEFTRTIPTRELDNDPQLKVLVEGNRISELDISYGLAEQEENTVKIVTSLAMVVVYLIVVIFALIIGFRRLRAYEIGFRLAIFTGSLAAVALLISILINSNFMLSWELVFGIILGPVSAGGGLLMLWALSESIGREVWNEKFISLDLLSRGHFLHSKIGLGIIRGIAAGSLAFLVFLILIKILAQLINPSFTHGDNSQVEFLLSHQPALALTSSQFIYQILVTSFFIVLIPSLLKKWLSRPAIILTIGGLILGMAINESIEPYGAGLFISIIVAIILMGGFIKFDILTAFLALFTYAVSFSAWSLLFLDNAGFSLSAWALLAGLLLTVFFAILTLLTKDTIQQFDNITPRFVRFINERQRLQRELEIAREVQADFLPRQMPVIKGLDIAAVCVPAQEVGGDYYDFIRIDSHRTGFAIGDVSGKGTRAAFYMTLTKGFLKAIAAESHSSAEVLKKVNGLFYENAPAPTFISMVYSIFDLERREMTLARAGHNPVLMIKSGSKKIDVIKQNGIALGLESGSKFNLLIEDVRVSFNKDDVFIFYTDGLTEAMNKEREEYGEERLQSRIMEYRYLPAGKIISEIINEVKKFTGRKKQHDDMTMIVVKINK